MAIIIGTDQNDDLRLTLDPARLLGMEDDRVAGLGGHDVIATGAGNDFLDGGADNDNLADGAGNDTVLGGDGDDIAFVDSGNDIYYGGAGDDLLWLSWIYTNAGRDLQTDDPSNVSFGIRLDLASTAVQDLGEFGSDQFFGFERVIAGMGNDVLFGTAGANDLQGRQGNDLLDGRRGNDRLLGFEGADILIGGHGADEFNLGFKDQDRDRVRFTSLLDSVPAPHSRDVVREFERSIDKIDFGPIDANPFLSGNQAFHLTRTFTKAPGEVRLTYVNGDTVISIDGDRDRAIDMSIVVKFVHLTVADLIL